jgi:hypothetical protein
MQTVSDEVTCSEKISWSILYLPGQFEKEKKSSSYSYVLCMKLSSTLCFEFDTLRSSRPRKHEVAHKSPLELCSISYFHVMFTAPLQRICSSRY